MLWCLVLCVVRFWCVSGVPFVLFSGCVMFCFVLVCCVSLLCVVV